MDALSLIAVPAGAGLVVALALHVWYALGLSRVFVAQGVESWRAWVPLINEAEVLRLGRIDPVRAVLFVVPFVNVYALVLKATAAHRLGAPAGRGAGTTALAVVFPPVWAAVLARTPEAVDDAAGQAAPSVASTVEPGATAAVASSAASSVAPEGGAEKASPNAQPISSIPGASPEPPPPAAAAGGRRTSVEVAEPVVIPVLPGPREIGGATEKAAAGAARAVAAPSDAVSDAAPDFPMTRAARGTGASRRLGPSSEAAPDAAVKETARGTGASRRRGAEAEAAPLGRPVESTAAAAARPVPPAGGSVSGRVSETTDATAERSAEHTSGAPAAPLDESTQTARPRSRRRGEWTLDLPDGRSVALTSRAVVLGRKPSNADESAQYIAVIDDTRTMSKEHARLEWTVTGWTVTDLDSTNGVALVHDDGRTERVPTGGAAVVPSRFRLGDAELRLRPTAV